MKNNSFTCLVPSYGYIGRDERKRNGLLFSSFPSFLSTRKLVCPFQSITALEPCDFVERAKEDRIASFAVRGEPERTFPVSGKQIAQI